MKRILVTGADGFVGRALCARLAGAGFTVVPVVRTARKQGDVGIGDLGQYAQWPTLLQDVRAVVHLAARAHITNESASDPLSEFRRVNVHGTMRLAEAALAAGVTRFVFMSSIGVNGSFTEGRAFRETDTPRPSEPYAISKWEAEQQLLALSERSGLELTRVRPPLVIGPHAKGNLLRLMKLVASGIPLPLGAVSNERSFVALDDLCDLLAICISDRRSIGELLLAANDPVISTPGLLREIARAMGRRVFLPAIPLRGLQVLADALGAGAELRRLTSSLAVDASYAKQTLSWRPAAGSLRTAIAAMVGSYVNENNT